MTEWQEWKLLTSQRNDVLEIVKTTRLEPGSFVWKEVKSQATTGIIVSLLIYSGTEYFFLFDLTSGSHYAHFSPGAERRFDTQHPRTWILQLECVRTWLTYLEREVNAPDLWADLDRYRPPVSAETGFSLPNDPFSYTQVERIQTAILEIRKLLLGQAKTEAHRQLVESKLDYLVEAAKRQGRSDWFHTSIGVLVTLASALALAPDQSQQIWYVLKQALGGVIQLLSGK
jgi:hypothetical protein